MRNKLLSVLMACALLLSMLPMSVSAAGELEIAVSEATISADGTADVTISLPANPGIMSMQMNVTYPSALTLTGADDAKALKNGVFQDTFASPFALTFGDDLATENDTTTGVIATLHFKAADGAAPGSYAVEIKDALVVDKDGDDVAVAVTNGSVTIPASAFTVTVASGIENGSVEANPTTAKEGDTVSLTATPASDCQFKAWDVKDADGKAVTVASDNTFAMPASNVTVSATFEKKSSDNPGGNTDNPGDNTGDNTSSGGGCYIATSVYGSYDCPQVWTLRRFRDDVLGQTWYGRLFIKAYYATSPTLVKWFGDAEWFQNFWKDRLDAMVENLQDDGFESTPYQDQDWQ